jgi:hypothetical protein
MSEAGVGELGAGSLQNLHDVVAPAAVGPWPPAPGWYWLIGGALLALTLLAYRQLRRWQRNRYRRAALKRLDRIRQHGPALRTGPELARLLKQTALAAWPRTEVASMSGAQWAAFLSATGATTPDAAQKLSQAGYVRSNPDQAEHDALCNEAEGWIRRHRAGTG